MKRSYDKDLKNWYESDNRKPLILRGARQVGKSTLVRIFAENMGLKLHEINLERNLSLAESFRKQSPSSILTELSAASSRGPIDPETDLLFLDEIQAIPEAIAMLRYFYEEIPKLPIIAAGSLLEFALEKKSFSMPVGRVQYLYMHQLSFEEFLLAVGADDLLRTLNSYQIEDKFPTIAHEKLLELLRCYMLIGGMPEVVNAFVEKRNFELPMNSLASICETYRDDFAKYATGGQHQRLQRLFEFIPPQIGKKVIFSKLDPSSQARDLRKSIELLYQAQVVYIAYHTAANGIPLKAEIDEKVFKIYFLDCGVLNYLSGVRHLSYQDLLDQNFVNEGPLAEQFIAQHLIRISDLQSKPGIHYWLREGKSNNAEVDFVIQLGKKIIPIEVKAQASGTLKSLHQFIAAKNSPLAVKFDLSLPSLHPLEHAVVGYDKTIVSRLLSLPLYLVGQLERIISATN